MKDRNNDKYGHFVWRPRNEPRYPIVRPGSQQVPKAKEENQEKDFDHDKTQGLHVWRPEEELELVWRCRKSYTYFKDAYEGYDYFPHENVLPDENRFAEEYAALPDSGEIILTGELLKEAQSWGLKATWIRKSDFVVACRKRRKSRFEVLSRWRKLVKQTEKRAAELRKPDNSKRVDGFIIRNCRDVETHTKALLSAITSNVETFLPGIDFSSQARQAYTTTSTKPHYEQIRPKKKDDWDFPKPELTTSAMLSVGSGRDGYRRHASALRPYPSAEWDGCREQLNRARAQRGGCLSVVMVHFLLVLSPLAWRLVYV